MNLGIVLSKILRRKENTLKNFPNKSDFQLENTETDEQKKRKKITTFTL